jgi:hypothetical protein
MARRQEARGAPLTARSLAPLRRPRGAALRARLLLALAADGGMIRAVRRRSRPAARAWRAPQAGASQYSAAGPAGGQARRKRAGHQVAVFSATNLGAGGRRLRLLLLLCVHRLGVAGVAFHFRGGRMCVGLRRKGHRVELPRSGAGRARGDLGAGRAGRELAHVAEERPGRAGAPGMGGAATRARASAAARPARHAAGSGRAWRRAAGHGCGFSALGAAGWFAAPREAARSCTQTCRARAPATCLRAAPARHASRAGATVGAPGPRCATRRRREPPAWLLWRMAATLVGPQPRRAARTNSSTRRGGSTIAGRSAANSGAERPGGEQTSAHLNRSRCWDRPRALRRRDRDVVELMACWASAGAGQGGREPAVAAGPIAAAGSVSAAFCARRGGSVGGG